jgi:hypothetical protein
MEQQLTSESHMLAFLLRIRDSQARRQTRYRDWFSSQFSPVPPAKFRDITLNTTHSSSRYILHNNAHIWLLSDKLSDYQLFKEYPAPWSEWVSK